MMMASALPCADWIKLTSSPSRLNWRNQIEIPRYLASSWQLASISFRVVEP